MSAILISHSHADGTLVSGDPRPHHGLVKSAGFRYSRNVGWYFPGSRDKAPRVDMIERLAEQLRQVGFEVEVEISNDRRSIADVEADRLDRAGSRSAGLAAKSEKKGTEATALIGRARELGELIPMGQPVLVDHYSAPGHLRHLDKIDRTYRKGFEAHDESVAADQASRIAAANAEERLTAPATIRRIATLEAEIRAHERRLAGTNWDGSPLDESYVARISEDLEAKREAVAYWKAHLAQLEESGVKLWGPDDFVKGDRIQTRSGPATIERVNKKSVTARWDVMPQVTNPCPYDKIKEKL